MDNRKFNQDEYLDLPKYDGHPKSKENPRFSIFSHEGGFFFAMLNNKGKAFLRSEGYANEKTRETGMNSVVNNSENKDRWTVKQEGKDFFLVLKAANHKEIARSGNYKSKAEAEAAMSAFFNGGDTNNSKNSNSGQDEYLHIDKYKGHKTSAKYKGFCTFSHDGQYYFGMLDTTNKVRLRSQGYKSEAARDNGIESVIKNRDQEKRWAVEEEKGNYYGILKAGNHQEIGRSGAYADKATAAWTPMMGVAAAGIASTNTPTNTPKSEGTTKNVLREEEVEDDYLPTKFYQGHKINDKINNIATFKHSDNQYYFALYNKDGSVKLRSEGFETAMNRDKELSGVLKYHRDKKMYSKIEKGKYSMLVLKDKNGNEIGRSPLIKNTETVVSKEKVTEKKVTHVKESKATSNKTVQNIAAATVASTVITKVAPVSYESVSLAKAGDNMRLVKTYRGEETSKIVGATEVARNVKYTEAIKYAHGASYMKFWWIPLLLLLIPLLGWLFGGKKTPPPPPPVEKIVEATPPPPVKQVVPPPVVPKCNCSELSHPIFLLPKGPAPKTTTALGRAPEYGNQHGKTPLEFYEKLKRAYKKSADERRFLDGIFKQMGYDNGFSDATADIFSAVTVPRGVEGNLGTKVTHKTVYRKLDPTNPKDLKAFHIKAKNACDLHFMKTCGNHFFFKKCDINS